jgi:hypothetical protein
LLISLVVGGIIAFVGYMLVKMVLHFAGGILGAILALLILSLLPISLSPTLGVILVIAGAGVVGFFGNRLGDWKIILATTLTGAYAILLGLTYLFPLAMGVGSDYLSTRIPFTGPAFIVLVTFLITGILAQFEIRRVRGRYVNIR